MNAIAGSIESGLGWAPTWLISLVEFGLGVLFALLLHQALFRVMGRLVANRDSFWQTLVDRLRPISRIALPAVALALVSGIAPLTTEQAVLIQRVLGIVVIALAAWMGSITLKLWITAYLKRFRDDGVDPFLARRHVTQTHILHRVAIFLIWFTATAAVLMTFDGVRQYGVSLLASAGAAGLIFGLALQPVLKNLIAGVQIAVTQPIRIGDALIVEGEYGTVEDIKSTFVQVRLWDLRRLVMPLSYFIERPFQNWTRDSANLIGSVMLYVDYSLPIAELRELARGMLDQEPLWDKQVFAVQVTDIKERTMELRVLMSAVDAPKLFDLRCRMREQLITLLQQRFPQALPRIRTESETPGPQGGAIPASAPAVTET